MLSDTMQAFRDMVEAIAPECERLGDMSAIHSAAAAVFRGNVLTPRECFALGEVYQCGSVESALFTLDELGEE